MFFVVLGIEWGFCNVFFKDKWDYYDYIDGEDYEEMMFVLKFEKKGVCYLKSMRGVEVYV